MTLHDYMLQYDDVLESINLKVDYCMSPFSLDEHGWNLIAVNHFELCAENSLKQQEWWPFVHCMYGLQACLSYNTTKAALDANVTCETAEAGADDDMTLSGGELKTIKSSSCRCSLSGAVDYCAKEHTSTTYRELAACAYSNEGHELAVASKKVAERVNGGDPLWIKVNNMTISLSKHESSEIESWASTVLSAVCNSILLTGEQLPKHCI